jgi:3-hydroxyethyl bacteriochlorophyllide a dehydrogenase
MPINARALIVTGPNQLELGAVEIPDPGPGQVIVAAAYSGISPGTEIRCLRALGDAVVDGWPYVPGYSMSGTVVKRGPGVTIEEGTRVHCGGTEGCSVRTQWGGHVSHALRSVEDLVPLPDNVDLLDASIAKLAAIAYHGTRFSQPVEGKKIAVIGLGPIGQLSARTHAALGADVVGGDLSAERVQALEEAGVKAIVTTKDLKASFAAVFPEGADVVVDATGVPAVLPAAIEVAKDKPWDDDETKAGARFIVQGSYPAEFAIPYQAAFMKELTFYLTRSDQLGDIQAAIALMSAGKLSVRNLISDVRAPEDAPATYSELQQPGASLLTVAFKWA